ncbi:hypothetical protein GCM10011391_32730 [Pullulanibacillus camelliae]|uniref:Uncharacterized protein n=1 Tax=Pullulanibacillus camelliae TaxID=1707096 RepID=A0A8J2YLP2_9BACL|nr:hypothetical protein [Pullulanibacillus camelliae]GGE51401.1 hypothetical protein GCM10011391_32730 [Pullulanibacillus camelliae]
MEERKQGLSVARIIDREKYYKNKALELEKELIFTKDHVTSLEQQIAVFTEQQEQQDEREEAINQLKQKYDDLEQRYEKDIQAHQQLEQELQSEIDRLNKQHKRSYEYELSDYNQKIQSYEKLLAEVQNDLNEKEKEIDIYKRRLSVMDKRLKSQGETRLNEEPVLEADSQTEHEAQRVLSFMDYALIVHEKRCMIRGELIIENVGQKGLGVPYICFRFTPGDAATIKGKIMSWESPESESIDQEKWQWAFLDTEWAEEAKERGEIWIYPTQAIKLNAGNNLIISDLQIPIETKYYQQIGVEVFVYFPEENYRSKAVNQILINF